MITPVIVGWAMLTTTLLVLWMRQVKTQNLTSVFVAQAVKSRGGMHREHQRSTSVSLPWLPRRVT